MCPISGSQRLLKLHSVFTRITLLFACATVLFSMPVFGGAGGVSSLASKETAKREAALQEAQAHVVEAGLLFDKGNYDEALRLYRDAYDVLPDAPLTAGAKLAARDGYSHAAVAQSHKLADAARYAEARALLKTVLEENFNPDNPEATLLLKQLDDADRFNPALTPAHKDNVAKVTLLLRDAAALVSLGEYDDALGKYQAALRVDAYNSAARRGIERVEQLKSQYFERARIQTRASMLNTVNSAWEQPVPVLDVASLFGTSGGAGTTSAGKDSIVNKLNSIIIPVVDLAGASLDEVAEFIRIRSRDLDPAKKGVAIVMKVSAEQRQKPVTLNMTQVPLVEVIRYVTEMTGTSYRIEEFAVAIVSTAEKNDVMLLQKYLVPPSFISNAPAGNAAAAPGGATTNPANPFAPGGAAQGGAPAGSTDTLVRRLGAKDFLESQGVPFPGDATATYRADTSTLFVRNTAQNLALIDALVEQAKSTSSRQVEVQVKLIEINQTNLNELGFDWLLGQSNVPGSSRLFDGGGTPGNQGASPSVADFPLTYPGSQTPIGPNPVTAGLRGIGNIFNTSTVDSLLTNNNAASASSKSPGIFAVTGVFTDPQFQTVLRGLNNQKGVDLQAAPSIITRSGQRANITIVRELRYPTAWTPPKIPATVRGSGAVPIVGSSPSAFEKRDLGIILDVEPVVGDDNRTVELDLAPVTTDVEGFIDYGTPIKNQVPGTGVNGIPSQYTNVLNQILQPVFRTNKVTTKVTVWDGQTVVLGGVVTDQRVDIQDKVPFLGDLPFIGRSFQSKASRMQKKAVIFFVTVHVIDPGGQRVRQDSTPATVAR